jgi:hypothetical protein
MWRERDWHFTQNRDEHGSMMWIDPIHVEVLHDFVMANDFKHIVEIGVWDGFSTSAMIAALASGKTFKLTCCDLSFRPAFRRVVSMWPVDTMAVKSIDLLQVVRDCDCVVIDGDHSLENVQAEFAKIHERQIPTIVAHDVGRSGDKGPVWLYQKLRGLYGWRIWFDDEPRPGMATDRGFMIATRDPAVRLRVGRIASKETNQVFGRRPAEVDAAKERDMMPLQLTREIAIAKAQENSLLDRTRLEKLYDLATECLPLEGDFVECGCGHGGTSALLASVLERRAGNRHLIVADTFEGLPAPDLAVDTVQGWTPEKVRSVEGSSKGSLGRILSQCSDIAPGTHLTTLKGLYADTLPVHPWGPIAMLHADADFYYSTMQILDNLYSRVVAGGIIVFDDYNFWDGCRKAVHEYATRIGKTFKLNEYSCAAWMRKE